MLAIDSMKNGNDLNLQLESTLRELPLWSVYVEVARPANDLNILFEQKPLLPGIILTRNQGYVGMISRSRFFEHMSRPYSFALFAKRSTEKLMQFLNLEVFAISEDIP